MALDDKEAFKWYRKAAERALGPFEFCTISNCYREGRGVPKDYVEAYAWLCLAGMVGGDSINVSRDGMSPPKLELVPPHEFEKQMSVEQLIAAKKRTVELRAMIDANLKSERK